jgi:Notch-like protein
MSIAIKCSTNYYTPSCNVRCVQEDSCYGGHYTCDPLTGNKICLPGFTDPATNCLTRNNSIQLCQQTDAAFCSNNGYCYQNLVHLINVTFPTCCCQQGFGGLACSDILSCYLNPCQNNGVCDLDPLTNQGRCTCRLGFTGKYCETKITCPADMYGPDCSVKCLAIDSCQTHQACDFYGNLQCKPGWGSFPQCNIRLIEQSIDPDCPQVANLTDANTPCYNGGSCSQGKCCCSPSYTGARCEVTVNQCLSTPCLNHGLCLSSTDSFNCICLPGYSGRLCQTLIDPCQQQNRTCLNGGVCVPLGDYTGFYCTCNVGYTGLNCEVLVDNCQSRPCLNNATCISLQGEYYCSCQPGFTGLNCESKVDFCSTQPCVHGKCSSLVDRFVCQVKFFCLLIQQGF